MLQGKLCLWDVDDAEALAAYVIERSSLQLSFHEHEDLLSYLVTTMWELSESYEPGGIRFSLWATTTLKHRVVDWQRSKGGRTRWQFKDRTYERELPTVLEYDDSTVVGTSEMDLGERVSAGGERMDGNGSINPAAYLPPRGLYLSRGVRRPPDDETERRTNHHEREAA